MLAALSLLQKDKRLKIKMCKFQLNLGIFPPLWRTFDKQVIYGQDTGMQKKLIATYKQNSS
jgi:hypothetical protein